MPDLMNSRDITKLHLALGTVGPVALLKVEGFYKPVPIVKTVVGRFIESVSARLFCIYWVVNFKPPSAHRHRDEKEKGPLYFR